MLGKVAARVAPRVNGFQRRSGPGVAWSGRVWEGAETGEDLGEQVVTGWQAQGKAASVADQASGDGQQPPPQGGDHGLAATDAMTRCEPVRVCPSDSTRLGGESVTADT